MYFRDANNELWKTAISAVAGFSGFNLGGMKTIFSLFISGDQVFFQQPDYAFWKIDVDGKTSSQIGKLKINCSPFVLDAFPYISSSSDNKVYKLNIYI